MQYTIKYTCIPNKNHMKTKQGDYRSDYSIMEELIIEIIS